MNKPIILILVNLIFAVISGRAQDSVSALCSEETEETNKALARRFYEQLWFSNNPAVVDEVFAPKYIAHDIGDRKGVTENASQRKGYCRLFLG